LTLQGGSLAGNAIAPLGWALQGGHEWECARMRGQGGTSRGGTPMRDDLGAVIAGAVARADAGDAAAKDALFAALYDELHRLAQSHLRRSGGALTISATTLLHEAYLALAGQSAVAFPDRNRFLGYASRAMRGLVVDYVRNRNAQKRGGDLTFTPLQDHHAPPDEGAAALERLASAIEQLALADPALTELVDLKFFCGFSLVEIAGMRGVSERTVQRDWAKARALLHQALHGD
jgi:RNA polymerase sigma factor (TIGR02999 family)